MGWGQFTAASHPALHTSPAQLCVSLVALSRSGLHQVDRSQEDLGLLCKGGDERSRRAGGLHGVTVASSHNACTGAVEVAILGPKGHVGVHIGLPCHTPKLPPLLFAECVCNYLGTVREDCDDAENCRCEAATGQCRCLPGVVGQTCDRCAPNTWRLASGTGCEPCDCDTARSIGPACNEVRSLQGAMNVHQMLVHVVLEPWVVLLSRQPGAVG